MANRTRGRIVRAQRRLTSWFQFIPVETAFDGTAGGTILFTLNAAALALRPFTIVRSHFMIRVSSDQNAASEDQGGAVGMAVVSDQASAIGVTAVPTPITDMGSDLWFVHQQFMNVVTITAAGLDASAGAVFVVDSKAMRKVDIGQDVVIVVEAGASNGFELIVGGRMLVKVN